MEGAEVQPLGREVCWSTVTGHSGSSPRWHRQAVANGQVHTCAEQVGGHQCRGETWSTQCLHGESCRRQPGMEGASEQSGLGRPCGQGTWSTASVTIGADQGCKGTKGPCVLDSRLGRSPAEPSHPRRRQTGQPPEPAQKTPAPCSVLVSSVRKRNIGPTAKEKR